MIGDVALRLLGLMTRLMGWTPDLFWQATHADVAAVLAGWGNEDAALLDRATLAAMMEAFPDG